MRTDQSAGVSLIELVVYLAISALMAVIAAPNLSGLIQRNKLSNAADDFKQLILFARAESIRQNVPTYLSPLVVDTASAESWGSEISVWADKNLNQTMDSGEELKRLNEMSGVRVTSTEGHARIQFTPAGRVATTTQFVLCKDGFEKGRKLRMLKGTADFQLDVAVACGT